MFLEFGIFELTSFSFGTNFSITPPTTPKTIPTMSSVGPFRACQAIEPDQARDKKKIETHISTRRAVRTQVYVFLNIPVLENDILSAMPNPVMETTSSRELAATTRVGIP